MCATGYLCREITFRNNQTYLTIRFGENLRPILCVHEIDSEYMERNPHCPFFAAGCLSRFATCERGRYAIRCYAIRRYAIRRYAGLDKA